MEYNTVYFSKEEIDKGLMTRLINFLCEQSYSESPIYNDIRICPCDLDGVEVSWMQTPWDREWGGRWEALEWTEKVYEEVILPDNSITYIEKGTTTEDLVEYDNDNIKIEVVED